MPEMRRVAAHEGFLCDLGAQSLQVLRAIRILAEPDQRHAGQIVMAPHGSQPP